MDAKPILLIRVNRDAISQEGFYSRSGIDQPSFSEQMDVKFNDYHVFCVREDIDTLVELEVFNIKDITETTIEELREEIKNILNKDYDNNK
jgi:hypothetical protein